MKKKAKTDKLKISKQNIIYFLIIGATLFNIFYHRKNSVYLYYEKNINRIENDLKEYRRRINLDIVSHLITLTNLYNQNLISNSYFQVNYSTNTTFSPSVNNSHIAVSNYPSFYFDRYFEINDKSYVSSGSRYYTSGDYINGLRIISISPQFVQIGDRFFNVGKPIKNNVEKYEVKEYKK